MTLKSFGCSLVWGSEMLDAESSHSLTTWPALLAQHLQKPYGCYAKPGIGNLQIAELILNQISASSPSDLFVINWTFIDRFDYARSDVHVDSSHSSHPGWSTFRPAGQATPTVLTDWYYRNIHSEYRDKITSLMHIQLCVHELRTAGIPFIMTYMDDLLWDQRWHMSRAIRLLQDSLQPCMQTFDGHNMIEYSAKLGHAIGANNHPLESAHRALFHWALDHFLIDKIKTS